MSPTTLAVLSQTGQSLSLFSLTSGARTFHLPSLTAEPHELCHDAARGLLYISHAYRHGHYWRHGANGHEISIFDLSRQTVTGTISTLPAKAPHGLAMDRARDILYASVEELPGEKEGGGGVIGIDLASRGIVKKTVPSGARSHWFAMTPDGRKAYTCNKDAGFISVLDLEGECMVGRIDVPGGCEEPGVAPDGRFVYFPTPGLVFATNPRRPEIKVLDTRKDEIVGAIPLKGGAQSVFVGPKGTLFVGEYTYAQDAGEGVDAKENEARLAIYDGESRARIGEVVVGLFPLTVRCAEDERMAFITNIVDGTVSVVDVPERKVVRTLEVDTVRNTEKPIHVGAHGMAVLP